MCNSTCQREQSRLAEPAVAVDHGWHDVVMLDAGMDEWMDGWKRSR